jgi:hypothetical protein
VADGIWDAVTAIATAAAALGAAVSAYYAYHQVRDAGHLAEVQAVAALSGETANLYKHFSSEGIDDVPGLTTYLYQVWKYRQDNIITEDYYDIQVNIWCSMTRASAEKLKIYWENDPKFLDAYGNQPGFIKLLHALIDTSKTAPAGCI